MVFARYATFALLALKTVGVLAATSEETIADDIQQPVTPNLEVAVSVSFPESEIFGIKLINGRATKALVDFTNNEKLPVNVAVIGGALSTLQPLPAGIHPSAAIIRNLTATRYDVEVPAGEKSSLSYSFTTDLNPQDLRLNLVAVVASEGTVYQVQAFNETVTVVEAATSIFDPQIIFLYLVLLSVFTGALYFVYKTWIQTLFPQTKRGGKGGERAKRSSGGSKTAVAPKDQVSVIGADGPAVTTGSLAKQAYDESWIPEHHIKRPAGKRGVSTGGKTKVKAVE